MPSTVADIFAAAGAHPAGVVPWGEPPRPPEQGTGSAIGIYVVSLGDEVDSLSGCRVQAPISASAVDELRAMRRQELTLDREPRPTREALVARLAAFWAPDEVVLYIGLAGPRKSRPAAGELARRVTEYYDTPLGANGPHAGGWPLKTLSCLAALHVHYAYCGDVRLAENASIACFARQVSPATLARLRDPVRVMPFANLEFPKGNAKDHGIRGARAPKRKAAAKSPRATATPSPSRGRSMPNDNWPAHHSTQTVTANDINAGQLRIPVGATKRLLPPARQQVSVILRGQELHCRWDPRYAPRERSGVIGIGKAAAAALLVVGDVLTVSTADGVIHLD